QYNSNAPTTTGSILGTPAYMSPEQAQGHAGHVAPAADVFALGGILYELLSGVTAFHGSSALEVIRQVTELDPVPPSRLRSGVPRHLGTNCHKCLVKEPSP